MMLLLLNELKSLHNANIIHRDIKPDNIMVYKRHQQLHFVFVDFGVSYYKGEKEEMRVDRVRVEVDRYKPPEMNSESEDLESDVYCLGKTFQEALRNTQIQVDVSILLLLEEMIQQKKEKRIEIDFCITKIVEFCAGKNYTFDILENLCSSPEEERARKLNFKQPNICEEFFTVREEMKKQLSHKVRTLDSLNNQAKQPNGEEMSILLKTLNEERELHKRELQSKRKEIVEKEKAIREKEELIREQQNKISELLKQIEHSKQN